MSKNEKIPEIYDNNESASSEHNQTVSKSILESSVGKIITDGEKNSIVFDTIMKMCDKRAEARNGSPVITKYDIKDGEFVSGAGTIILYIEFNIDGKIYSLEMETMKINNQWTTDMVDVIKTKEYGYLVIMPNSMSHLIDGDKPIKGSATSNIRLVKYDGKLYLSVLTTNSIALPDILLTVRLDNEDDINKINDIIDIVFGEKNIGEYHDTIL